MDLKDLKLVKAESKVYDLAEATTAVDEDKTVRLNLINQVEPNEVIELVVTKQSYQLCSEIPVGVSTTPADWNFTSDTIDGKLVYVATVSGRTFFFEDQAAMKAVFRKHVTGGR